MTTIVKRFVGQNSYAVSVSSGSTALPAGFVIPPGSYVFSGVTYDCNPEGYYVFWDPISAVTARRIVYNGDAPTFMSSLTHAVAIGSQDDALTTAQINSANRTGEARLLCGYTAVWAKSICDSLGGIGMPSLTTRLGYGLTGVTPSGYFDGHTLLEASYSGGWHLHDLAAGIDFGGLALKDALPAASITRGIRKDVTPGPLLTGGFDCDAWVSNTLNTDSDFASEFSRVLQIPALKWADGKIHCYLPAGASGTLATSIGWIIETQANWLAGSYP